MGCCARCYSGYGLDENKRCQKCDSNCSFCSRDNYTACSSCIYGYYIDTDNTSSTYQKCILLTKVDNCASYYSDSNICEKCENGYSLRSDNTCKPCEDPLCEDCHDLYFICNKCKYGSRFVNNVCVSCSSNGNCDRCSSEDNCSKCISGYFLNENNECIKKDDPYCTEHQKNEDEYKCTKCDSRYAVNESGRCEPCKDLGCLNCTDDINTCNRCQQRYYLKKWKMQAM